MGAIILEIASYFPDNVVTNQDLATRNPEWSVDRIAQKTGIEQRHIVRDDQFASDLAVEAAQQLFSTGVCQPSDVDYVLLCTQSPDYLLPTTACLVQHRLGIPKRAGALDFNLGCSGYIYGLGVAQGLIETGQASKVLLLTAETYSKFLDIEDRSSVTLFGDAAAATLIGATENGSGLPGAYVYGTDGAGADHLIVKQGGMRFPGSPAGSLRMNGPEVFRFALDVVPECVQQMLEKSRQSIETIDLFVFHQANRYMLDHLRNKLNIPEEKFYVSFAQCGNTVSSTIPIALQSAIGEGRLKNGDTVMLVGFGVGLSWGATVLSWPYLHLPA